LAPLLLVGVVLIYFLNPPIALKLPKKLSIYVFGLFIFLTLISRLMSCAPLTTFIVLALLSVGSYFVREYRARGKAGPRSAGKAERNPVLPRGNGEE
jgi:NADH:ubiquinone oxidoreductase subunit 2 (subunit N)